MKIEKNTFRKVPKWTFYSYVTLSALFLMYAISYGAGYLYHELTCFTH